MKRINCDIAVIGSGIAGLFYAIRCASFAKVVIVTKGNISESNTMYAQGGIAAVMDKNDSIENHIRDTLNAGDGLCNTEAVKLLATNARECVLELERLHVQFNKTESGQFDLHREGGHSCSRVVHYSDATGKEIENALVKIVRNHPNITILENHFVIDLLMEDETIQGVSVLDASHTLCFNILSKLTMLATGGAGQVYLQNTNPEIATGDGFAMAYRAGAIMMDMEFVQFHPTTLYSPDRETFLITEAIRGFGAELKNRDGKTFMEYYHPMKSLAPRDTVTWAILNEMNKASEPCVFLDLRCFNQKEVKKHFPNIYTRCEEEGLDLSTDMIPVVPAAHYMCGGVKTDLLGRTNIENLYSCGECSCTGVHGANRLASNSLLEGLVFAKQAALDAKMKIGSVNSRKLSLPETERIDLGIHAESDSIKRYLQNLMWKHAGIIRDETGLDYCLNELYKLKFQIEEKLNIGISKDYMELLNMIETSQLIVSAALQRNESRGCHFRKDFPLQDISPRHTLQKKLEMKESLV